MRRHKVGRDHETRAARRQPVQESRQPVQETGEPRTQNVEKVRRRREDGVPGQLLGVPVSQCNIGVVEQVPLLIGQAPAEVRLVDVEVAQPNLGNEAALHEGDRRGRQRRLDRGVAKHGDAQAPVSRGQGCSPVDLPGKSVDHRRQRQAIHRVVAASTDQRQEPVAVPVPCEPRQAVGHALGSCPSLGRPGTCGHPGTCGRPGICGYPGICGRSGTCGRCGIEVHRIGLVV